MISARSSFPSIQQPFNWACSLYKESWKAFQFCFKQILRLFENGWLSSWFGKLQNIIQLFFLFFLFFPHCVEIFWSMFFHQHSEEVGHCLLEEKLCRKNYFFFLFSSLVEIIVSTGSLQVSHTPVSSSEYLQTSF